METAQSNLNVLPSDFQANPLTSADTPLAPALPNTAAQVEKNDLLRVIQPVIVDTDAVNKKLLKKPHLINKLNFINFQDGDVLLKFRHTKYDRSLTLLAKPQPCSGNQLDCRWVEPKGLEKKLRFYDFESIFISDGQKLLIVEPNVIEIDERGISFLLPDSFYQVCNRKVARHPSRDIRVQLIQNSSLFKGTLLSFNAFSFHLDLTVDPPQTFKWINSHIPASLIVSNEKEVLFTGECRIIKESSGQKTRTFIVEPLKDHIQRFKNKKFRSLRQQLTPSPTVTFRHPFNQKVITLKVLNISGSGLSVEESLNNAMLPPGMILPELEISFGISSNIKCKTQVVYRSICEKENKGDTVKCGLALLDMDSQHHAHLLSYLQHAENSNSHVCNKVDMDALWDFFFETGFIYPDKYEFIEKNKQQIKETYQKLYTKNPKIARHFIYQEKGLIMGHMAMVRFFENSWLIHHHAARKSALNRAGLIVLDQIGNFTYDSYRLYSLHMDFLMCYFRPENKFPNRVFGGAAERIGNRKGCSVDTFAYTHHHRRPEDEFSLPHNWSLAKSQDNDFFELADYYEFTSGGLVLNALDLEFSTHDSNDLSEEFCRLGFKREKFCFSLKKSDTLKVFFLVTVSDIGLNLSNLTNSILAVIIDSIDLKPEILQEALSMIMHKIGQVDMPVLLYPHTYADESQLPYEKLYNLWIMRTDRSDLYFSYVKRLLRYVK